MSVQARVDGFGLVVFRSKPAGTQSFPEVTEFTATVAARSTLRVFLFAGVSEGTASGTALTITFRP